MHRIISLCIVITSLTGCNALKKLYPGAGQTSNGPGPLPDDYTVTGKTAENFQVVPVRVDNSGLAVEVSTPGAQGYRVLNDYEYDRLDGTGGGIKFGYVIYPTVLDGKLLSAVITDTPAAPTGSQYKIRSVLASH